MNESNASSNAAATVKATKPEVLSMSSASVNDEQQAKYKETCNKYVSNGLTNNRSIQYLIQQLDKMGCTPPKGFVRCTDCGDLQALGAFHLLSETKLETPDNSQNFEKESQQPVNNGIKAACSSYFSDAIKKIGQSAKSSEAAQDTLMQQLNQSTADSATTSKTPEIFLCQQHLSSEGQAHRTIVHELIHAVDTCRSKMNPQKNCIHLACTEIRAENLSSECNFFNELFKVGPHSLKKHGQECVKRRALLSVSAHPRCRDKAEEYVDAAMGRCYKDIFPFERHPNEQG